MIAKIAVAAATFAIDKPYSYRVPEALHLQPGIRVQVPSSCIVYGMPRVAYELGAVEYQEKLQDVAKRTYQLLYKM